MPLSDRRQRDGLGGAAVLRQLAVRHLLAHNGNLTNAEALKRAVTQHDHRHINTDSDTEVLLNVLAHELSKPARQRR